MTESHKSTSSEDDERSRKILNTGTEARSLLDHPMMVSFFEKQTADAVNSFANLPDDAGINDYKAVHMRLKALDALKGKLERHIADANYEQLKLKEVGEITDNI